MQVCTWFHESFPRPENYKFAADSQNVLQYLLDSTSTPTLNTTLTIWGSDIISNDQLLALKNFISQIGKNRVYVDTAYDLNSDTYKPLLLTIFENIFWYSDPYLENPFEIKFWTWNLYNWPFLLSSLDF